MGVALATFLDSSFLCGPQAPTVTVNGPSRTQLRVAWVEKLVYECTSQNIARTGSKRETEDE